MTAEALVQQLCDYYKGSYSTERIRQLNRFASNIPEADREAVFISITEERSANTAITVADMKEACGRIGVSFRESVFIRDERVTCDCCGEQFRYAPAPTEEQTLELGIHCRCPNCGFQYAWTLQAEATVAAGGSAEWYEWYLAQFERAGYGTGKEHGRWYQKDKDLAAVNKRKREIVENKVQLIRRKIHVEAEERLPYAN